MIKPMTDETLSSIQHEVLGGHLLSAETGRELLIEVHRLREQVAALHGALQPFALRGVHYDKDNEQCGRYADSVGLELEPSDELTVGDLRRAASIYESTNPGDP